MGQAALGEGCGRRGLCSPSAPALAAPWLGRGTAPAALTPGVAALGVLVLAPGYRASRFCDIVLPARGTKGTVGQNSSAGTCDRPHHEATARIYVGDWQCPSEAGTERHQWWEWSHIQGEAMLPRDGGSGYLPHHQSCSALCPQHPAPRPASAEGLSIPQGHRRHRRGCTSLGLAPPSRCAHSTELTPAAKPPCASPSPHPANIPPARSNTATATTGPQPRPHRARGIHSPPKAASPALGSSERSQAGPWTTNLSHCHGKARLGPDSGHTPAATLEAQAGK